jgi:hypothetical protein
MKNTYVLLSFLFTIFIVSAPGNAQNNPEACPRMPSNLSYNDTQTIIGDWKFKLEMLRAEREKKV